MKLAIIGAGKWGQALFHAFSQKNDVVITSRTPRKIPGFVSVDTALAREYLVLVLPAQHVRAWMEEHFVDRGQKILVAAKGIEIETGALLNEILESFLPPDRLAYLAGPSLPKR